MGKAQSFADKVNKGAGASKAVCPECETEYQRVKSVRSVKGEAGTWKFSQKMVDVCKCNEKEVYAQS